MKSSGLESLLEINGINLAYCQQALYEAFRTQCFAQICDILRTNNQKYVDALRLYRVYGSSALFAQKMVEQYCTCQLDSDSYVALGTMFRAFFRKNDTRKVYPDSLRHQLLVRQNHKCALCRKTITDKAELDHIIPWLYVGDELDDNLQMLCHSCNSKKRASLFYPLQSLLCNAKGIIDSAA